MANTRTYVISVSNHLASCFMTVSFAWNVRVINVCKIYFTCHYWLEWDYEWL